MNSRIPMLATLAAAVVVMSACPTPPPPAPPAPVINQDSIDAANRARAAEEAERMRREAEARAAAEREAAARAARDAEARAAAERAAAIDAARRAFSASIYFALDKSELSAEARATLDSKLALLRTNTAVRIRISGHTDERGSDAYNIALGQRRAAAAKRYLVDNGIAADRIDVVSFGEDRPAMNGSDESAWSQNRRDEFEIIVGGETLRLP